ncbi:MAG: HEAT repeat domain-containing protein [Actinomycetota bacterium]
MPDSNKNDYKYITDDDSEEILRQERALQPLLLVLKTGTPEVRAITIEAVGAIPTDAATKVLEEALSDPDEAVREAAKAALARRGK